jgi:hypothetical protein
MNAPLRALGIRCQAKVKTRSMREPKFMLFLSPGVSVEHVQSAPVHPTSRTKGAL